MSDPTISKDDLFRAVLALDVYHRGYNGGLGLSEAAGTQIGDATIGRSSSDLTLIGGVQQETIGFYALEYTWNGTTVISYRGTDSGFDDFSSDGDVVNGYGIGAARPDGPQARAAIEFYKSIAGGDPYAANIELTGQSLGGGIAGYVGALYDKKAVLFSNMNFERAALNAYNMARDGNLAFQPDTISAAAYAALGGVVGGVAWLTNAFTAADVDAMRDRIWDGVPTVQQAPDISQITSFSLEGEILSATRLPISNYETLNNSTNAVT